MTVELRKWHSIEPREAAERKLSFPMEGLTGPLTQEGIECPWPWDPIQLVGAPIGMYHCPYCGEMVVAGLNHMDYRGYDEEAEMAEMARQEAEHEHTD